MRVLVVEDHPTFQAALITALEQRGHDVVAFESAERAWDAWQQAPFPLVLLDRSLSGMDGLAFCRRLRGDEHGRSSVIVILTGSLDPSDLGDVLDAGADDYSSKLDSWDQTAIRLAFAERRARSVLDRWRTQNELKQTDARFSSFMDNAPAIAWTKDADGQFVYRNRAFAETFGRSADDGVALRDADLWPDAADMLRANDALVLSSGRAIQVVEALTHQDGTTHHWLASKFPLRDTAGAPCVGGMAIDVTDRIRVEQELAFERELLQTIMDNVPDFLYVKDRASRFIRMNSATARFLGLRDPADAIGKTDLDFFPEPLGLLYYLDEQTAMASGVPQLNRLEPQNVERSLWYLTSTVPITDGDGEVTGLVGIARDVTERRQMEELIGRSEERQRALLTAIPDLIVRFDRDGIQLDLQVDQRQVIDVSADDMIGQPLEALLMPEQAAIVMEAAQRALTTRTLQIVELVVASGSGHRRFEGRIVPSGDDELMMIGRDVTDQRLLEEQLAFQASHDALTELPNRSLFHKHLERALSPTQGMTRQVAVLFIDLDGFKAVNDQFGHSAGDHLLVELGRRLQTFASDTVFVARLGGDEFAVLMANTALARTPDELAICIQMDLSRPVRIEGLEIRPSLSIGIATGEVGQSEPARLLRQADSAMYQAKQSMAIRPVAYAGQSGGRTS